jgi:hypothetical protein
MNVIDLVTAATTFVEALEQETYEPRNVTENDKFVAMMQRMIRALERRAIDDPAMLPLIVMLEKRLTEVANVVVATSAAKYGRNPLSSPSMLECAKLLQIGKSSISQRRAIGDRILAERLEAQGVTSFAAAARERKAREDARKLATEAAPKWAEVRQLRAV